MKSSMLQLFSQNVQRIFILGRSEICSVADETISSINVKHVFLMVGIALLAILFAVLSVNFGVQPAVFEPEQQSYYAIADTRIQTRSYMYLVVLCFSCSIIIGVFRLGSSARKGKKRRWVSAEQITRWFPLLMVLFTILVALTYRWPITDFIIALVFALFVVEVLRGKFTTAVLTGLLAAVVLVLFVGPFFLNLKVPDGGLWVADIHWSAVFSQGLFNRTGEFSPFGAFDSYGVLLNGLIFNARKIALFSSVHGTHLLTQLVNLIFLAVLFLIVAQRFNFINKRVIVLSSFICVMLFAPLISNAGITFNAPNLQPIRFLALLAVVALSYYIGFWRDLYGWLMLGCLTPVLLLYNSETGVFCMLAVGFALTLKSSRSGIAELIFGGIAFVFSGVICAVLLNSLIFDSSIFDTISELFKILSVKAEVSKSGFGGLPYFIFTPFIILTTHSLFQFSKSLMSIRTEEPLTPTDFQGNVLIGLIVAMGSYVIYRYSYLNMWMPLLLYVLFLLPKLNAPQLAQRTVSACFIIIIIMPFIMGNPFVLTARAYQIDGESERCIDGLSASQNMCEQLNKKAHELMQLHRLYENTAWTSGVTLAMHRLTDIPSKLGPRTIFFRARNRASRNEILEEIKEANNSYYLYDRVTENNILGIPQEVGQFQQRLFKDAGYTTIRNTENWVLVKRNLDP